MDSNFLRTKFSSMAADGVERFPKIQLGAQSNTAPSTFRDSVLESASVQSCQLESASVQNCQLGSLSSSRKTVIFGNTFIQKRVFCVLEYPDESLESSINFLDQFLVWENPSTVLKQNGMADFVEGGLLTLKSLISKLNLANDTHLSFAVKCVPRKGIPLDCAIACSENHLLQELIAVQPKHVLLFGHHAIAGYKRASSKHFQQTSSQFEHKAYELPSLLELFANPSWRLGVWNELLHLKRNE